MRPARILHLTSSFAPGGKEVRTVRLINHFGARAEHVLLSAMPDRLGAREGIARKVKAEFPGPDEAPALAGRPSLRRYAALAAYMKRFDIVLSYNWGAMDGAMAHTIFAPSYGLPPLLHHEDGFNEDEAVRLKTRRNWFRMAALARARALIVPSETLERIALERWKQPADKVRRIPNGIDVDHYLKKPQRGSLPGYRKRKGELLVGTLAGLRAVKNLPRLVRAVAAAGDNLRLAIVGAGPDEARIRAEAEKAGIADRLIMPGHIADPVRVIGLFDIFALSSDSEQFPISLVEAMAAGLPVAATDVGDVSAMVSQANRRFVVARDDAALAGALRDLAGDEPLRAQLGEANRRRAAAEYNEAKMLARYEILYGWAMKRPDFGYED